jgi:D-amino peptidase
VSDGFSVAIVTDLEGVACVTDRVVWNSADTTGAFDEATRLFAGEVNAAAGAAFDAGAGEVVLVQGHAGSFRGRLESFDQRARIALNVPFHEIAEAGYDRLMLVGYHSMADAQLGVLSHSFSDQAYVAAWLNGTLIGEIGHMAALFGEHGTPLVFVSGDAAACREAEELVEGVFTAPVKEASHRFGAVSLSPETARNLIHRRAVEALEAADDVTPLAFEAPIELVVEFSTTDPVERNAQVPGIEAAGPRRMVIRGETVTEVMRLFALTGRIA